MITRGNDGLGWKMHEDILLCNRSFVVAGSTSVVCRCGRFSSAFHERSLEQDGMVNRCFGTSCRETTTNCNHGSLILPSNTSVLRIDKEYPRNIQFDPDHHNVYGLSSVAAAEYFDEKLPPTPAPIQINYPFLSLKRPPLTKPHLFLSLQFLSEVITTQFRASGLLSD